MFCSVFLVLCKRSCLENFRVLSMLRFMICRGYFLASNVRVRL